MYLPFTMMPNIKTNFDGTLSPFTTSTSPADTFLGFNGVAVSQGRLIIDGNGITISGVTLNEFQSLQQLEYNTRYNLPAGSYATPPGFTFYSISGGTYDHYFDIVDRPVITANSPVFYWQNHGVNESTFLLDALAITNDGSPITSNFNAQVDFAVPGTYRVTLNSVATDGTEALPVDVEVIIKPLPLVTAKVEITYYQNRAISSSNILLLHSCIGNFGL